MKSFTCTECAHEHGVASVSIKIINGEARMSGDVCPECGGRCKLTHPKKGVPNLGGMGRYGISK